MRGSAREANDHAIEALKLRRLPNHRQTPRPRGCAASTTARARGLPRYSLRTLFIIVAVCAIVLTLCGGFAVAYALLMLAFVMIEAPLVAIAALVLAPATGLTLKACWQRARRHSVSQ